MTKPKILIVDDHALFADGLTSLFESRFETYCSADGPVVYRLIDEHRFALVLLDLDLGGQCDAYELLATLSRRGTRTLVVSGTSTKADRRTVVALGARGFLDKTAPAVDLLTTMDAVLADLRTFPEELLQSLVGNDAEAIPPLTERETAVLNELMRDPLKNNPSIALRLHISEGRVRNVLSDIFRKFGVGGRHHLIDEVKRRGWSRPADVQLLRSWQGKGI